MPELIKFEQQHAYMMNWHDIRDFYEIVKSNPNFFATIEQLDTLTLVEKNRVLGIVLCQYVNQNHCDICFYMSSEIIKNFNKHIYQIIKDYISDLKINFVRISAIFRVGNDKLNKLVTRLGFQQEAVLKKYYLNGDNALVWAIVEEK